MRQRVVRDVSFHSNMAGLIMTPAHIKAMGKLHGVPLLSQVMENMMAMETVMWKNVTQVIIMSITPRGARV